MNSSGEQSSLKRTSALKISEVNIVKAQIPTHPHATARQGAELAAARLFSTQQAPKTRLSRSRHHSTHELLTAPRSPVLGKDTVFMEDELHQLLGALSQCDS